MIPSIFTSIFTLITLTSSSLPHLKFKRCSLLWSRDYGWQVATEINSQKWRSLHSLISFVLLYFSSETGFQLPKGSVGARNALLCRVSVNRCTAMGGGRHLRPLRCPDLSLAHEVCEANKPGSDGPTKTWWVMLSPLSSQQNALSDPQNLVSYAVSSLLPTERSLWTPKTWWVMLSPLSSQQNVLSDPQNLVSYAVSSLLPTERSLRPPKLGELCCLLSPSKRTFSLNPQNLVSYAVSSLLPTERSLRPPKLGELCCLLSPSKRTFSLNPQNLVSYAVSSLLPRERSLWTPKTWWVMLSPLSSQQNILSDPQNLVSYAVSSLLPRERSLWTPKTWWVMLSPLSFQENVLSEPPKLGELCCLLSPSNRTLSLNPQNLVSYAVSSLLPTERSLWTPKTWWVMLSPLSSQQNVPSEPPKLGELCCLLSPSNRTLSLNPQNLVSYAVSSLLSTERSLWTPKTWWVMLSPLSSQQNVPSEPPKI